MKFLSVCPAPKHIRLQSPAAKRTNSCRSYNGPISPTVSAERDWAKLGRSSSSSSSSAKQCSKIQQSLRRDEEDVSELYNWGNGFESHSPYTFRSNGKSFSCMGSSSEPEPDPVNDNSTVLN